MDLDAVEGAQKLWEAEAKRVLKSQLARAGVSYKVLVARLEQMGIPDNEHAVASRISRGKFSFVFFMQCMAAINVTDVRLSTPQIGPKR